MQDKKVVGYLYAVKFDNEAVKVGKTTKGKKTRIQAHKSNAERFGVNVVAHHVIPVTGDLDRSEKVLIKLATAHCAYAEGEWMQRGNFEKIKQILDEWIEVDLTPEEKEAKVISDAKSDEYFKKTFGLKPVMAVSLALSKISIPMYSLRELHNTFELNPDTLGEWAEDIIKEFPGYVLHPDYNPEKLKDAYVPHAVALVLAASIGFGGELVDISPPFREPSKS